MLNALFDRQKLTVILFSATVASCTPATPLLSKSICIETNAGCFQVIQKDSQLPTSYSTSFSNVANDSVSVNVYQGESDQISENRLIGEFTVPINEAKASDAQIQVTISIDEKKNLTVIAQNLKTNEVKQFQGGVVE